MRNCVGQALRGLGLITLAEGRPDVAKPLFVQGLVSIGDHGKFYQARAMQMLATVELALGEYERAALLFGAAEAMRHEVGMPVLPVDAESYSADIATVRAALGEHAFSDAWQRGASLSWDESIAAAVDGSGALAALRASGSNSST
jgi:ATP/maltotriose-dependent transcriptional regulator MalT